MSHWFFRSCVSQKYLCSVIQQSILSRYWCPACNYECGTCSKWLKMIKFNIWRIIIQQLSQSEYSHGWLRSVLWETHVGEKAMRMRIATMRWRFNSRSTVARLHRRLNGIFLTARSRWTIVPHPKVHNLAYKIDDSRASKTRHWMSLISVPRLRLTLASDTLLMQWVTTHIRGIVLGTKSIIRVQEGWHHCLSSKQMSQRVVCTIPLSQKTFLLNNY